MIKRKPLSKACRKCNDPILTPKVRNKAVLYHCYNVVVSEDVPSTINHTVPGQTTIYRSARGLERGFRVVGMGRGGKLREASACVLPCNSLAFEVLVNDISRNLTAF